MTSPPLLIVSPAGWRDVCFSLPATRALAANEPITVLCEDSQRSFWEARTVGPVISHDGTISGIATALPEAERVLLWEDGPAAKACAKAKIHERCGLPAAGLAKHLTRPLERRIQPGPPEHAVRRFLDTAAALGAEPMRPENFVFLPTPEARDDQAILVVPDSDFGRHYEWPMDRWKELLEKLKGRPLVLADGVLARALGHETTDISDPNRSASFGLCIAADGSIPHVAAAYGTTCAVLYGPGDPELSRPLGKQHLVIRRKVECSPCFTTKCPLDLRCQNDLGVEQVIRLLA